MAERLPPHDMDAEEAVCGSLLIDGAVAYKVESVIQPVDFYGERNRLIYEACLALLRRDEAINQITIAQELARLGKLETCGGAAYLSHLISVCPTSLDIEHYAQIVYRLSMNRRLISAAEQISAIGFQADPDVDASLNRAEDVLFKLRHGQTGRDFVHIRQLLDKYFEGEAPTAAADGKRAPLPNIQTGYTMLDDYLGGLQRSDLVIVAGRPSMGKTSLALNIARNAAVIQGAVVAMFSLEMSQESLVQRLLAGEARINSKRIKFGYHTEDEEKRIMDATGILSEAPIYIDDTPMLRVIEMRSKIRRLYYESGVDLIIIDHLGLMQSDTRIDNRVQEVSFITRSLKALARELNVPLVAVSQLSRASEFRTQHKPQLSDLRDSGSIEQDADVVMFIYRDEYYFKTEEEWLVTHPNEEYPKGIADIIIAKQRNGPTGEIKLRFEHTLAKFENMPVESAAAEQSLL